MVIPLSEYTEANGIQPQQSTISEHTAIVSKHITDFTPHNLIIKGFKKGVETTLGVHGETPTFLDPGELACSDKNIKDIASKTGTQDVDPNIEFLIKGFLEGSKKTLAVLSKNLAISDELSQFEHTIEPMAQVVVATGDSFRCSTLLGAETGMYDA